MPRHLEDDIQVSCIYWFSYQFPKILKLLIAIPNGGRRNRREAARLKKSGVVPGVSDLVLFIPNQFHHALCIEIKSKDGRQSQLQKDWQKLVEVYNFKYVVCRSLDEFRSEVQMYLRNSITFL